ncbi:MAG TPA: histidine kinase [Chryseosolibacter sp.]
MGAAKPVSSFNSRWIKDIVFCSAAYFVLLSIFASSSEWQMIDHIYTSIFLGTLIVFGTINEWVIQKRFLKGNKLGTFLLLSAFNVLAGAFFNHLLFDKFIDVVLPGYYFISYYEYADLVKFFFVYIFLLTLLGLSWEWFQLQDAKHQMTVLEKEKINAELKSLTNQVNPHFLFNSLTVLYGLALKKSDETPDAILKLSNTLRYVIYESARGKVKLSSEISLIENYIELQKYRVRNADRVSFERMVQREVELEPMLLLPLVENSFKHGLMGDSTEGFIRIHLFSDENQINFSVVNNKGIAPVTESGGGIGLKNIEERLRLIYPNRYSLSVEETDKLFTVKLNLKNAR